MDPEPVVPEGLDPDPVYPERLDPDPVNIRPDPQPCRPGQIGLNGSNNYKSNAQGPACNDNSNLLGVSYSFLDQNLQIVPAMITVNPVLYIFIFLSTFPLN